MKRFSLLVIIISLFLTAPAQTVKVDSLYMREHYDKFEYRIPMRDGAKLFTLVYMPKDKSKRWPILMNRTWQRDPLAMDALALLAMTEARPTSPRITEWVDRLLSRQPWTFSVARGLVIAALARHQGRTVPARSRLELTIDTGGEAPRRVLLDERTLRRTLEISLGDGARTVPVHLRAEGRGRAHFSAVLRGFSTEIPRRDVRSFSIRFRCRRSLASSMVMTPSRPI